MDRIIFIDCTHTYHTNVNSGIQRVVRNIIKNSETVCREMGYKVQPVIFENNSYIPVETENILTIEKKLPPPPKKSIRQMAFNLYHKINNAISKSVPYKPFQLFMTAPKEYFGLSWLLNFPIKTLRRTKHSEALSHVKYLDSFATHEGNVLLLLDFAADLKIWPLVKSFKEKSGKVKTVVYDLIPLNYPETTADYLYKPFKDWLDNSIRHSDKIITISKFVATEVTEYIQANHSKLMPVEHFYLGSELDLVSNSQPKDSFLSYFKKPNCFISVGSIEPRKNHKYILDAFDIAWKEGFDITLIIIGKQGWKNEDLIERILGHKELNHRLFLVRDASDDDLNFAYKNARALIFSSIVEGFGLPIVESFQKGLAVLCSDIPVFREIASEKAAFFDLENPHTLVKKIENLINNKKEKQESYEWINWNESTKQLIKASLNIN